MIVENESVEVEDDPKRSHRKQISFDSSVMDEKANDAIMMEPNNTLQVSTTSNTSTKTPPRKLRGAIRATRAQPQDVESYTYNATTTQGNRIKLKDIVKIFSCSKEDFDELTPEQVDRVKTMHERMEEGANFSFNYNVLLLVSSVIAGLGLVSDNGTTIIASMLVSPIMGPVVGLAYGCSIRDWKLVKKSFRNEFISLVFCIVIGLVIGLCTGNTGLSDEWPTAEMASRGTKENFLVALPVAFFSGLGVAVSLLDDSVSSLVGVAISASLLPPAVNAGILWIAYLFTHTRVITLSDKYGQYHEDMQIEIQKDDYRRMGVISLGVTLSNIILIWIGSMLMFRIKEVLPIKKKVFWEDLGVARKIYQNRALLRSHRTTTLSPTAESSREDDDEAMNE